MFLVCGRELRFYVVVLEDRFDSFGDVRKLPCVSEEVVEGCWGCTSPGGALSMKDERALSADMVNGVREGGVGCGAIGSSTAV